MRRPVLKRFASDARGASMVEFSIIAFLVFAVTGGLVDFLNGFYQWNSATKALQQGARLASISDPVAASLKTLTGLETGAVPGDSFPYFKIGCGQGSCSEGGYDGNAMNTIIYGHPNQSACGTVGGGTRLAMCHIFRRIKPENVKITYEHTGLGFAGRPGGAVPTITLELTGLQFEFVFLNGLLGFDPIEMPAMKTTATGEDMYTRGARPTS